MHSSSETLLYIYSMIENKLHEDQKGQQECNYYVFVIFLSLSWLFVSCFLSPRSSHQVKTVLWLLSWINLNLAWESKHETENIVESISFNYWIILYLCVIFLNHIFGKIENFNYMLQFFSIISIQYYWMEMVIWINFLKTKGHSVCIFKVHEHFFE